ncbi:hypothetical protein CP02DC22_0185A, partial [Chlamydia psittaci 02DC22]
MCLVKANSSRGCLA